MMAQDDNKTVLYGIRKIQQGAYKSNTMFPICIKAVSEYLGDDVSYPYLMAATGAAFRLAWNRTDWDLSNIDIYHTLRESNEIYRYGAKALGREFDIIEREADTKKETFTAFIRSKIAKGFPVIALGIIGPPEPCIVAGYDRGGDVLMGWNFFQDDAEFAAGIGRMDNGYFLSDTWWENTDTQAVMCIGGVSGEPGSDSGVIKMASEIMEPRNESFYAKGIRAYDVWKDMLLDETWFENSVGYEALFSKLLVQNDAMVCISDGRKWAAEYFEELSQKYGEDVRPICRKLTRHFREAGSIAREMMGVIGDWSDMEKRLENFRSRPVRERIGKMIDAARREDQMAYEQIKLLSDHI